MTGWRIGLALAPSSVTKSMAALQSHVTSGTCHPAQYAAAAAFADEKVDAVVDDMVKEFGHRRDIIVRRFRQSLPGLEFVEPLGAFYFFFRVDSFASKGVDAAMAFCEKLLAEHGVALVPGEAFGDPRWVRMSFAASEASIQEALNRLVRFIESLEG
jgi:aspartate aminotransferase